MNPLSVYEDHASGRIWSDIQDHLPKLRACAKGNVVEIGVRSGISTSALLVGVGLHGGHVWSVDIDPNCAGLYDDPNWTFIRGHSVDDFQNIRQHLPEKFDLLFIDADHVYQTTRNELLLYVPLVRKDGGVILMHDVDLVGAGVRQALDEYAKEIGKTPIYHRGSYGMGQVTL